MAKFHLKALTEKAKDGKLVAVASEETLDRQGDIIEIDGWELKNFKKNPQMLWMHNITSDRSLPIGKAQNVKVAEIDGKRKLIFEPIFEEITDFGRTVKKFFDEGLLNAFSVGFDPIDWEAKEDGGYRFKKQELLEISAVTVPALQSALIIQRAKDMGMNMKMVEKIVNGIAEDENKGALPFHADEILPDGASWDAGAETSKAEVADLKQMCAWVDGENTDKKSAYKLPHHTAEGHKVVWRGVAAAMAALLGSRGGVDIPEDDRKAVYNHLKKHYAQFEKEVPEFRNYEPTELRTYWIDGHPIQVIDPENPGVKSNRRLAKVMKLLIGEVRAYKKLHDKPKAPGVQVATEEDLAKAIEIINQAFSKAEKKLNRGGGDN